MAQAVTTHQPRGAHRRDGLDSSSVTVSHPHPARLTRGPRTGRARPAPVHPRTSHPAPRVEVVRESAVAGLRTWAGERPFLAGLCLIGAGAEIGCWPAMPRLVAVDSAVSAVMFAVLLVSHGAAVWFAPIYRKMLGVQAAVLGLLALSTANVGGLFLGTAAAVAGGTLASSWRRPGPAPQHSSGTAATCPIQRPDRSGAPGVVVEPLEPDNGPIG